MLHCDPWAKPNIDKTQQKCAKDNDIGGYLTFLQSKLILLRFVEQSSQTHKFSKAYGSEDNYFSYSKINCLAKIKNKLLW